MIRIEDYDTAITVANKLVEIADNIFLRELISYLSVYLRARNEERKEVRHDS